MLTVYVDAMNIFNLFRSKPHLPTPPVAQAVEPKVAPKAVAMAETTFLVKDGDLHIEASTLDEYHQAFSARYGARELLEIASGVEGLKSQDGSRGDVDDRDGHVVLPNQKFEYHSDTQEFKGKQGATVVSGNATSISANRRNDNKDRADWNLETGRFSYTAPERQLHRSMSPTLLMTEVFPISADGHVELPTATSLEGAEEIAPRRELGVRAEELIQAASQWQSFGRGLDQSSKDINPGVGAVLPGLKREDLENNFASENVMWTTPMMFGEYHDEEEQIWAYDVAADAKHVAVSVATECGSVPDVHLKADLGDDSMKVRFHNSDIQVTEEAIWSKTAGTVTFLRYENQY